MTKRDTCVKCSRTLLLVAAGLCRTCYRRRAGHDRHRDQCVECHRLMPMASTGRCWTCYHHQRHPETRRTRGPKPHADWSNWSDMFARNIGPVPARLRPHERRALAAVARTWAVHP